MTSLIKFLTGLLLALWVIFLVVSLAQGEELKTEVEFTGGNNISISAEPFHEVGYTVVVSFDGVDKYIFEGKEYENFRNVIANIVNDTIIKKDE